MFRLLSLCGAALAAALSFATPARAQDLVYGAYCGEVTFRGQAPIDTWVIFLSENRWSAPISAGPFTDVDNGTTSQSGSSLSMFSNRYTIVASALNGRIVGEVTADDGRRGVISMTQMNGTGAGLRSSSVPPDFSVDGAREALSGDINGVRRAVTWAWSPQGSTYWRTIYESGQLPDHATAALRDWVRREEAGERPACDAQ
jgi:hypothetical protein